MSSYVNRVTLVVPPTIRQDVATSRPLPLDPPPITQDSIRNSSHLCEGSGNPSGGGSFHPIAHLLSHHPPTTTRRCDGYSVTKLADIRCEGVGLDSPLQYHSFTILTHSKDQKDGKIPGFFHLVRGSRHQPRPLKTQGDSYD